MKRKSLVSIVVPVYNTGEAARQLVEKILHGKYLDVEIILVDDGSSDDSLAVLQKIKNSKVKVFSKENGGPSAARNFGIEKSSGEYLLFVDSDDEIEDGFVEKLVDEIQKKNTALAMTGVKYCRLKDGTCEELYLQPFVRKENEGVRKYVLRSLLADGRMYPAFNKIFDAEVVKKNNLRFDEKMNYGEDTKFVLDYLKVKDGEIRFVLEPLYIYNVGTETSTAAKVVGEWKSWRKCYKNLKKWVGRKTGIEEKMLLGLVYLKWRASWLKARIF